MAICIEKIYIFSVKNSNIFLLWPHFLFYFFNENPVRHSTKKDVVCSVIQFFFNQYIYMSYESLMPTG